MQHDSVQFVVLIVFSMRIKYRCSLSGELDPLSVVKRALEVGAVNGCNQHWFYLVIDVRACVCSVLCVHACVRACCLHLFAMEQIINIITRALG